MYQQILCLLSFKFAIMMWNSVAMQVMLRWKFVFTFFWQIIFKIKSCSLVEITWNGFQTQKGWSLEPTIETGQQAILGTRQLTKETLRAWVRVRGWETWATDSHGGRWTLLCWSYFSSLVRYAFTFHYFLFLGF